MVNVKICIIDDNKEYLSLLNDTIKKHFDNTNILCLSKYDEDIEKKDFFFIDIDLNNENGIDVAKKIICKYPSTKLIFVTTYNDLVYSALSVQPFYFIRKDHLNEDLSICFQLMKKSIFKDFREFKLSNGLVKQINLLDIIYVEVFSHYLHIYDNPSSAHIVYMTLKKFIENNQKKYFVQIHKSYLINLYLIEKIENQICYLKGGISIPIGRTYKKELLQHYKEVI